MAVTQGRTGFQQTISNGGTWDVLFEAGTDGAPMRGIELSCITQNANIRITGGDIHRKADATLATETLVAGDLPKERFCFRGDIGMIVKVEAQAVVDGAQITWAPILNSN